MMGLLRHRSVSQTSPGCALLLALASRRPAARGVQTRRTSRNGSLPILGNVQNRTAKKQGGDGLPKTTVKKQP